MTKHELQTREFARLFGHTVPQIPMIPDAKTRELLANLIFEEVQELLEGLGFSIDYHAESGEICLCSFGYPHMPSFADGAADTKYTINFAAALHGIDLEPFEDDVCESNLTKTWTAYDLLDMPPLSFSVPIPDTDLFLVKRASDGKVLKPKSYRPARTVEILREQGFTV